MWFTGSVCGGAGTLETRMGNLEHGRHPESRQEGFYASADNGISKATRNWSASERTPQRQTLAAHLPVTMSLSRQDQRILEIDDSLTLWCDGACRPFFSASAKAPSP